MHPHVLVKRRAGERNDLLRQVLENRPGLQRDLETLPRHAVRGGVELGCRRRGQAGAGTGFQRHRDCVAVAADHPTAGTQQVHVSRTAIVQIVGSHDLQRGSEVGIPHHGARSRAPQAEFDDTPVQRSPAVAHLPLVAVAASHTVRQIPQPYAAGGRAEYHKALGASTGRISRGRRRSEFAPACPTPYAKRRWRMAGNGAAKRIWGSGRRQTCLRKPTCFTSSTPPAPCAA